MHALQLQCALYNYITRSTITIHALQLQYTLYNSVIIPTNRIMKNWTYNFTPPPSPSVTWLRGGKRGNLTLPFTELRSLKAVWATKRNVYRHRLETPHMTRIFLFLLRQRSGYILVCFLRFIERGCQCAGYIYIYIYIIFPYWQCQNKATANKPVPV
jgi:hypothetical protein